MIELDTESNELDTDSIFNTLREILNKVPSKYYADILYESVGKTRIDKNGRHSGDIITCPKRRGFVFRIFNGERFTELSDNNAERLAKHVEKSISYMELKPKIELQRIEAHKMDITIGQKINIDEVEIEEKINKIHEIEDEIYGKDECVKDCKINYQDRLTKKIFLSNEGTELRQVIPRTQIIIQPVVLLDGKKNYDYKLFSIEGGWELFNQINDNEITDLVNNAKHICLAPAFDSNLEGKWPVILAPSLSGLVAHECIGHALHADQFIRERSFLKKYYKYKIASDCVNISDSAVVPGVFGSYIFDDEGIIAKKTELVKDGVISGLIHNRITSSLMNEEPHGNGRRESFLNPVYPRMTNTFIEPGTYQFNELIEDIKKGIYLTNASNAKEDPLEGTIQITSRSSFLIENGEISKIMKGVSLSGPLLDFIQSIDAVSKESVKFDQGSCGYGMEDHIPYATGGVHLRTQSRNIRL